MPGTARIIRGSSREPSDYAIRDLSLTGARIVGRDPLCEGEQIRVTLELELGTVSVGATVVRTEIQNAQAAIAFHDLAPDVRATIADTITILIERARATSQSAVIILHGDAEMRDALQREVALLNRTALICATPLEVTWALHDSAVRTEAIIIGDGHPSDSLGELLGHLAETHPRVRRVLVFGEQLAALAHASARLVDAVIRTPLRSRPLARALGVSDADSSLMLLPADSEPSRE